MRHLGKPPRVKSLQSQTCFARLLELAKKVSQECGVCIWIQRGAKSRVKVILDEIPQTKMVTQRGAREWLLQYREDH